FQPGDFRANSTGITRRSTVTLRTQPQKVAQSLSSGVTALFSYSYGQVTSSAEAAWAVVQSTRRGTP
ncbi:hypothetical protein, partial [Streptomyces sp. NPDC000880]